MQRAVGGAEGCLGMLRRDVVGRLAAGLLWVDTAGCLWRYSAASVVHTWVHVWLHVWGALRAKLCFDSLALRVFL